jgi:hypothetical protein
MTVTGKDVDGNVISEVIAGPNANTINLTKYYKTITSIVAASTLGANTMDVGWTAICVTPIYPLAVYPHGTSELQTTLGGTTCNYTPQHTIWPICDPDTLVYTPIVTNNRVFTAIAAAGAADLISAPAEGATAVRVLVNSHTNGVLNVAIAQPRA